MSAARRVMAVGLVAVMTVSPVAAGASTPRGATASVGAGSEGSALDARVVVPTPARTGPPNAIAVLGDSISAGTGAIGDSSNLPSGLLEVIAAAGQEQPENSWATGTNPEVNSLYLRLREINPGIDGNNYNLARNGANMSNAPGQANQVPLDTEYVVIQMGGNDLCKSRVDQMATPEQYRANIAATLAILSDRVPNALIGLSSIPDIYNLWYLRGAPNPPNPNQSSRAGTARLFWGGLFGLAEFPCQSLLASATNMSDTNEGRRQQVRTRNMELNEVLAEECAKVLRCLFDDYETFSFTSNRDWVGPGQPPSSVPLVPPGEFRFVDDDISTLDHFHPSLAGHVKLAREAWRLGPDFTDATAPVLQLEALPGAYRATATDDDAVLGFEYRVYERDAGDEPGGWIEVPGDQTVISAGTGDLVEVRVLDVNGNLSASQVAVVVDVPGQPVGVAGQRGDGQVTVSWQPPVSNGGSAVTGYRVVASPGGSSCEVEVPETQCVVSGLVNGQAHVFTVTATNKVGYGNGASVTVTPAGVPGPPQSVSGTPGNGRVMVTWEPPLDDGGSPITAYTVVGSRGGATCSADAPATGCEIEGLSNGLFYRFTVTATNDVGSGQASAQTSLVIPRTTPGQPRSVVAVPGDGEVALSWLPPLDNGGAPVGGYRVIQSGGAGVVCAVEPSEDSCVVAGLENGVTYRFVVAAFNVAGEGDLSSEVTATPVAEQVDEPIEEPPVDNVPVVRPPAVVTGVAGSPDDGQVALTWDAPVDDGGSPVSSYIATASPGDATCVAESSGVGPPPQGCTLTGLVNGVGYLFTVRAVNASGESVASQPVGPFAPRTVPASPEVLQAVVGEGRIAVSWQAPLSDGGAPVTGFAVTVSPGAGSCRTVDGQTFGCEVTGLTTSGSYLVSVVAENEAGVSPAASLPRLVTPGGGSPRPQFDDVPEGAFFTQATSMLVSRGITTGIRGTGNFNPAGQVNRAEMAAFLWRLAGEPDAPEDCGFSDRDAIPRFARAGACWLKATGVTTIDPYRPLDVVNRAQMAAFLWRFAGEPESPVSCGFRDEADTPPFARAGACWLKATGVTTNDPYQARGVVNRAQMAAFLYRLGGVQGMWVVAGA